MRRLRPAFYAHVEFGLELQGIPAPERADRARGSSLDWWGLDMQPTRIRTSIRAERRCRFHFPLGFTLPAGQTSTVSTRTGTNAGTSFFLNKARPVWDNNGDQATVFNAAGEIAAQTAPFSTPNSARASYSARSPFWCRRLRG